MGTYVVTTSKTTQRSQWHLVYCTHMTHVIHKIRVKVTMWNKPKAGRMVVHTYSHAAVKDGDFFFAHPGNSVNSFEWIAHSVSLITVSPITSDALLCPRSTVMAPWPLTYNPSPSPNLCNILPHTLTRQGMRHWGRSGGQFTLCVCVYVCVLLFILGCIYLCIYVLKPRIFRGIYGFWLLLWTSHHITLGWKSYHHKWEREKAQKKQGQMDKEKGGDLER